MPAKTAPEKIIIDWDKVQTETLEAPGEKEQVKAENRLRKKAKQELLPVPERDVFDDIYETYQKCFPLKSEQESKANFQKILASNPKPEDPDARAKEMWVYLRDEKGTILGASNFDVFAGTDTPGVDGTVHGIYMFVNPACREQGVFKRLVAEREKEARKFIRAKTGHAETVVTFAEQNSPLLMTPREYLEDSSKVIDQCQRRIVFDRSSFDTLIFPYVQPELSEGQGACTYLDIVTKGYPKGKPIPSGLLKEHFSRFFELSFPEGTSIDHEHFKPALEALEAHEEVSLLSKGKSAEGSKFAELSNFLSIEKVKEMRQRVPKEERDAWMDTPLWQHLENLAKELYGKDFNPMMRGRESEPLATQAETTHFRPKNPTFGKYTEGEANKPGWGVLR